MSNTGYQVENELFPLQAVTATTNLQDFSSNNTNGGTFFLNITAASGTTPTIDLKLQAKCVKQNIYIDIPGAAFGQKTAAGTDMIVIAPGITVSANKAVATILPITMRWVATVGGTTPSFTASLVYVPS